MVATGYGTFRQAGEEHLQRFIKEGGLKPADKVLDVGCDLGRMAAPLTRYLDENSHYEGFDISRRDIKWCQKQISTRYPNFHFQVADIYNKRYNPRGRHKASGYRFPYEDDSFDFVIVSAIFPHMLPPGMENYFSEIARVLKKDGKCFITFRLLNTESSKLVKEKKADVNFCYEFKDYWTVDKRSLHHDIAYDEQFIRGLYKKYGLDIKEPIRYGWWCGRRDFLSHLDIIVASKV
jgi:SAM-dependent methyltransferase